MSSWKLKIRAIGAAALGVCVFGCASSQESRAPMERYERSVDEGEPRGDMGGDMGGAPRDFSDDEVSGKLAQYVNANEPAVPNEAPAPAEPKVSERKVIYTANFSVLVAANERAVTDFLASVTTLGGYLSQRQDNTLTVRVPAENFRTLTDSLGDYGAISSQNISSQDVTDSYLDVQLRLGNAKNARARLLVLMQSAEKTEDLLKIEREITRLSEVIETLEGKLRHMGNLVALSTVTVRFYQNSVDPIPVNKRKRSRFEWINLVGVENALQNH